MAARDEIIAFIAIVDHGTFSAAAEKLNITTAGVSRRIKTLEERLGIRLLNRTTRTATLTEAGKIYDERVRELLAGFDEIEKELSSMSGTARGALKIAAPTTFSVVSLSKLLPDFLAQYPDIDIRVDADDKMVDVIADGYDLAIRISQPHNSSLEAMRLAPVKQYIVASPHYLKKHGTPETLEDLSKHNCLLYSNSPAAKDGWLVNNGKTTKRIDVKGNMVANNGTVLLNAAIEGTGITMLPEFIVKDALASGEVVSLFDDVDLGPLWLYALYPGRQMMPTKVKVFLEFLETHLSRLFEADRDAMHVHNKPTSEEDMMMVK